MKCSNCGYLKAQHSVVDNQLLCLQKAGVFQMTLDRFEFSILSKDARGKTVELTGASLGADTTRLHRTIQNLLETGHTSVIVHIKDGVKFKEK